MRDDGGPAKKEKKEIKAVYKFQLKRCQQRCCRYFPHLSLHMIYYVASVLLILILRFCVTLSFTREVDLIRFSHKG